jgi:DNA modification methylase
MKPVSLVERAVANSSQAGDVVYDPFCGSGTTVLACERLSRRCRAIEIEPRFCDVVIDRWQNHTGERATRIATNETAPTVVEAGEGA